MQSTIWSALMLVAVVCSIPLALWVLKRLQLVRVNGDRQIDILHQVSVGARERIAIVQVRDRHIVVGITPQQISLLIELDLESMNFSGNSPATERPRSMGAAFAEALANTRSGFQK
jgi:flagellar biosynthetic protein FliO